MIPLELWVLLSAGLGFSIHKKWWGMTAFFAAMLVWMLAMQFIIALQLHSFAG